MARRRFTSYNAAPVSPAGSRWSYIGIAVLALVAIIVVLLAMRPRPAPSPLQDGVTVTSSSLASTS